jgi:hypothetical protein
MERSREHSVIIKFSYASEVMAIIRELRDNGLVQGDDFDFKIERHDGSQTVRLYFNNPARATFYRIKYS